MKLILEKEMSINLLKGDIYESCDLIPSKCVNSLCNLFNTSINDEDRLCGTNIGSSIHYDPKFFEDVRKKYDFDTCTLSSPSNDKVVAACFMNPDPIRAWDNHPEWFYDEENPVYLSSFGVDRNFRNRGIGSKLLDWLVDEYSNRGFGSMLFRVNNNNNPAINIYKRKGFLTKLSYFDPNDNVQKNIMFLKLSS